MLRQTNQSEPHAYDRSARPTCGGSSTASERGTAANALYACLTFMGNSSGEEGEGARGCSCRGGWGRRGEVMEVGSVRWKRRRGQTETWRRGETMKENQQSSTGERHGGWFHEEEEERCGERETDSRAWAGKADSSVWATL